MKNVVSPAIISSFQNIINIADTLEIFNNEIQNAKPAKTPAENFNDLEESVIIQPAITNSLEKEGSIPDFNTFNNSLNMAVNKIELEIIKSLFNTFPDYKDNMTCQNVYSICEAAIEEGNAEGLEFLLNSFPKYQTRLLGNNDYEIFRVAAVRGKICILQMLIKNFPRYKNEMIRANHDSFALKILKGTFPYDSVKFLIDKSSTYKKLFIGAILCSIKTYHNFNSLKFLLQEFPHYKNEITNDHLQNICCHAALRGEMEIIKFFFDSFPNYKNKLSGNKCYGIFVKAAEGGKINVLEILIKNFPQYKEVMIKSNKYRAFYVAARDNHINALQYLVTEFPNHKDAMILANREALSCNIYYEKATFESIKFLIDIFSDKIIDFIMLPLCHSVLHKKLKVVELFESNFIGVLTSIFNAVLPSQIPTILNGEYGSKFLNLVFQEAIEKKKIIFIELFLLRKSDYSIDVINKYKNKAVADLTFEERHESIQSSFKGHEISVLMSNSYLCSLLAQANSPYVKIPEHKDKDQPIIVYTAPLLRMAYYTIFNAIDFTGYINKMFCEIKNLREVCKNFLMGVYNATAMPADLTKTIISFAIQDDNIPPNIFHAAYNAIFTEASTNSLISYPIGLAPKDICQLRYYEHILPNLENKLLA